MNRIIEAVYENGVLRPTAPLSELTEGQRVWVTVEPEASQDQKARQQAVIKKLEAEGKLERFVPPREPPPVGFRPLQIAGPPLSKTIIEERR